MKKPLNDPFETVAWALDVQKTPKEVLEDVFSNDPMCYFKASIQLAFRSVMHNTVVKAYHHAELFRVYLRINSLILVGAYFYKKHKKYLRKEESIIDNTTWQNEIKADQSGYLKFYADPLFRICCLYEMDKLSYWKADWAYFVMAAMRKRKSDNSDNYPQLNYFIQTLIDALYEIHQST